MEFEDPLHINDGFWVAGPGITLALCPSNTLAHSQNHVRPKNPWSLH